MTTERQLNAAYDEVARYLNYAGEFGQEVFEVLDDVAEEANDNGLTPDEKKREMLLALAEIHGAETGPIASRAFRILTEGYDADGGR